MLGNIKGYTQASKAKGADDDAKNEVNKNYTTKAGDTPAKLYKLFNFQTEKEFRKYARLSDTAQLKTGTQIKVPTVPIETTFSAVSRKYNMSLAELKVLNPQIKDFNNIPKAALINVPSKAFKQDEVQTPKNTNQAAEKTPAKVEKQTSEDISQAVSGEDDKSPALQIAETLKEASKKTSAVEKEEFTEPFAKISKNTVEDVIKSYDKISPKESLIDMICSEWGSSKDSRKNAVMDIFNKLADKKGGKIVSDDVRKSFETELNEQFDSFGFVSTKKLDKIINDIINEQKTETKSEKDTTRKVFLGNGTVHTQEKMRKDALNSGREEIKNRFETFKYAEAIRQYAKSKGQDVENYGIKLGNINATKAFCKKNKINANAVELDISRVKRPLPVVNEKGTIVPEISELMPPTNNKGELKGKVIFVNAGHGGYQAKNGSFDPGAISFAKDASGKYVAVEEFTVVSRYTDDLVEKLRSKGASVVRIQGTVNTMSTDDSLKKLIDKYGAGKSMFISLHADSAENKSGSGVLYNPHDNKDTILSKHMDEKLNAESWIKADTAERPYKTKNGEEGSLYVLNSTKGIPSNLLEIEYLSGTRAANLNSSAYQTRFINAAVNGIVSYYQPEEK